VKAWRARQCSGGNSGTAAPPALTVVSVSDAGAGLFDWLFSGSVTVTAGACPSLQAFDPDAGVYKSPTAVASGGGAHLTATYDFPFSSGIAWRVLSQPTAISQAVAVPESGTTL
jgi:hypothetical protein